jgi:hypothetical protein
LPTKQHGTPRRRGPSRFAVFPIVFGDAAGVTVVHAIVIRAHHPAARTFALFAPIRLVFVVEYGDVAIAIGNA